MNVAKVENFTINDTHQLDTDIGVKVVYNKKEGFVPLIERNAFWWQPQKTKNFIVNESTETPIYIDLYKRDANYNEVYLDKLVIEGLPPRPPGTTKLSLALEFPRYDKLNVTVSDVGFGELFPVADYRKRFVVSV